MLGFLFLLTSEFVFGQTLNLSAIPTHVNCKSGNTGSIQLTVTGGQDPYTFLWSNGETTQNISGLTAGSYTVNVKDANSQEKSLEVTITEPEFPLTVNGVVTDMRCYGTPSGSINLDIHGGTQPYFVNWSNGSHELFLNNLPAGSYNVDVIDINGCFAPGIYFIHEPSVLSPGIINTTAEKFCFGGTTPIGGETSPNAPASGGTAPLTYTWQLSEGCNNNWTDIGGTNNPSYTPVSPPVTTCYRRKVVDQNGCEAYTDSKKFEMYPDLVSQTIVGFPSATTICSGTSVSATFTGGSGGFEGAYKDIYEFSINAGTSWSLYIPGDPISTSGLSGTGIVKIRTIRKSTGVDGCNWGDEVETTWNVNPIPLTPSTGVIDPICAGSTLSLTASTVPGATYNWTGPNSFATALQNPTVPNATTAATGTYSVTATVNGCTSSPATISAVVNAIPSAPVAGSNSPICSGSALNLTASTITEATYNWTGPNGFTSIEQNPTILNATASNGGIYYVTAKVNGCTSEAGTTSITITAVPTAVLNYAGSPFCNSLTISQNPTLTGTGAYTGGTYSAPAGLNIDALTGAVTPSLSTPGTYSVTYTIPASGGCAAVQVTGSVIITALPTASISYAGSPFCKTLTTAQGATLNGTGAYTGGTYSSITGLSINNSTGAIVPSASNAGTYTVIYNTPASGGCVSVQANATIAITAPPVANFSYSGSPYCSTASNPTPTFSGGGVAGTFSSTPGLVLNSSTGQVNISASSPGTYTVTNTIPASNGCAQVTATSIITITALPVATFSYAGSPYCKDALNPPPTFIGGGAAGTFTSISGLNFVNVATGQINIGASTAGTYVVTNTFAATGGCPDVSSTSSVTITAVPTAILNYAGSPFCNSLTTSQNPTLTGTGAYTGGIYSAPAGLNIDPLTGAVTPNLSTPGTYSVTYTIPASGGCAAVQVTGSVTITALPTASISYAGSPFCKTLTTAQGATLNGTGANTGGTYSSGVGLSINSSTGAIVPSASNAGTYTVIYNTPASGGCVSVQANATIAITAPPVATFSYSGSPYCSTSSNPTPTFSGGGIAGTFSSTMGLVFVSTSTGQVNLSASTPGTYTVTNTIPASNGCSQVIAASTITITALPVATFSYAGSPYCKDAVNPFPTFSGGGTAGTFSSTSGLNFVNAATGQINIGASTAGTYTVTNTRAAAGGCPVVSATNQVIINPVITNNSIVSSTPICSIAATTLNGSVPVGGGGLYTYLWQSNTTSGTSTYTAANGTNNGANYTIGTLTQTTWFRRMVTSGGCLSYSAPIQVNVTPVIPNQNTTICSGASINLTWSTTLPNTIVPANTTYTWTVISVSPGITGATAQSNPQQSITQTLVNTTNYAQTVTYSVTPTGGTGCIGNAFQLTVTVNPRPNVPTQTITICSGTSPNFAPVNNLPSTIVPSGTLYTWTISGVNNNISGVSAQLSQMATVNQVLTNSSTTPQTVTYTVTPVGPNCTGNPFQLAVTVNPKPTLNNISALTICSGSFLNIPLLSNVSGATFSWSRPAVVGISNEPVAGITTNLINEALINSTSTNKVASYYITPIYNGCSGAVSSFNVTVQSAPGISGPLSSYEGSTETYTTEPGRASYLWSVSPDGTIISGLNTNQIQVLWGSQGAKTVTITDNTLSNGCINTKTIIVNVYPPPTVSFDIVKSGSYPANPSPGDIVSYTITYHNTGGVSATNVVITDYLPPTTLFTYQSSDNSGVYNTGTNTVVWNIANVPPNGSGYVTVTGILGRLGTAYSYNPTSYYISNGSGETTLTNNANIRSEQSPVGTVSQHVSAPVIQRCGSEFAGGNNDLRQGVDKIIYYPLTINNTGNVYDNFTFSVPSSITVAGGGTIRLSIVDLNKNPLPSNQSGWIPPNGSFTFLLAIDGTQATKPKDNDIFNIVVTSLSSVCNSTSTATVKTTTYNGNPLNQQDVQITKTASVGSYTVGSGPITYTIVMTNIGQSNATNVTLTDNLPSNAPVPTLADITSDFGTPVISGNTITWTGINISPGDIFRYTVKVYPTCTSVPALVNSATATLDYDKNFNNNSSSVTVNVIPSSNPPLLSTSTPVICSNTTASLNAAGAIGGEVYRWYISLTETVPFTTGNSVTSSALNSTTTFYASIYDPSTGCESNRASITIVVSADVTTPVFQAGSSTSRCQGAETVTYSATAENSTGITYTLDNASVAAGNTINASTGVVNWVNSWSGTSVVTAIAAGCHAKTAAHTITTRALPGTSAIYHR